MTNGITICTWSGGREPLENLLISIQNVTYPVLIWVNDSNSAHYILEAAWREKFLSSLEGHVDIHMNHADSYEIGAIYGTLDITNWEEFILLQDTFQIKNIYLFNILFDYYVGQSVFYNPFMQMYLGKYRRTTLQQIEKPKVSNKIDAIQMESTFMEQYKTIEPNLNIFNPNFVDGTFYGNIQERFGRKNLVMEDDYIIKYKGTWYSEVNGAAVRVGEWDGFTG